MHWLVGSKEANLALFHVTCTSSFLRDAVTVQPVLWTALHDAKEALLGASKASVIDAGAPSIDARVQSRHFSRSKTASTNYRHRLDRRRRRCEDALGKPIGRVQYSLSPMGLLPVEILHTRSGPHDRRASRPQGHDGLVIRMRFMASCCDFLVLLLHRSELGCVAREAAGDVVFACTGMTIRISVVGLLEKVIFKWIST